MSSGCHHVRQNIHAAHVPDHITRFIDSSSVRVPSPRWGTLCRVTGPTPRLPRQVKARKSPTRLRRVNNLKAWVLVHDKPRNHSGAKHDPQHPLLHWHTGIRGVVITTERPRDIMQGIPHSNFHRVSLSRPGLPRMGEGQRAMDDRAEYMPVVWSRKPAEPKR